jgi:hypothetical protein
MNRIFILALLCTFSVIVACRGFPDSDTRQAKALMRMSGQERQRAFANLQPNKQLDVYMAGATKFGPPIMFEYYVAANWKAVLPSVKERLVSESDRRLAALMPILVVISDNFCSLAERDDVLSLVSQATPRVGELYRASVEEDLRKIAHPTKQLPPCK